MAYHGSDGTHRISVRIWRGTLRNGYHFSGTPGLERVGCGGRGGDGGCVSGVCVACYGWVVEWSWACVSCVLLWSAFHDHVRCLKVVVSCCVVVVLSCSLLVVVVMSWSSCWCRVTRCLSRESIRQEIFIDQERRRPTTLRYRRRLNRKPCRLEIGGRLLHDSLNHEKRHK